MTLELSIVAPVFNEGPIVEELAERCAKAASLAGVSFEILLVDDCSTDNTKSVAGPLKTPGLRFLHLEKNRGQFGATQAGLSIAAGAHVLVLDGDLQDPPEVLGALVERMSTSGHDVVFAVKESRVDAPWMKVFAGIYGALQVLGRHRWPRGAGSYCIMSAELARRVSRVALVHANLAAVVIALGARPVTLPYRRAARWDVNSHIGAAGLVKEAVVSLALTGALGRLLGAMAVVLAGLAGLVLATGGDWGPPGMLAVTLAAVALALALWLRRVVASATEDTR